MLVDNKASGPSTQKCSVSVTEGNIICFLILTTCNINEFLIPFYSVDKAKPSTLNKLLVRYYDFVGLVFFFFQFLSIFKKSTASPRELNFESRQVYISLTR